MNLKGLDIIKQVILPTPIPQSYKQIIEKEEEGKGVADKRYINVIPI